MFILSKFSVGPKSKHVEPGSLLRASQGLNPGIGLAELLS